MTPTIRETVERDAYLNLLRAHELLLGEFEELFRSAGITHTQFNVLRLLLTSEEPALPCQAIGDGLLHRVPDVTRLIDRMEKAGLVSRTRSSADRRVVLVRITAKGKRLCERLYPDVEALHDEQFAHLSQTKLAALNSALEAVLRRP